MKKPCFRGKFKKPCCKGYKFNGLRALFNENLSDETSAFKYILCNAYKKNLCTFFRFECLTIYDGVRTKSSLITL